MRFDTTFSLQHAFMTEIVIMKTSTDFLAFPLWGLHTRSTVLLQETSVIPTLHLGCTHTIMQYKETQRR